MPTPDLIGLFIAPLNQLELPYMVTGAVAAVVYGEPRLTRDIDIVVDLTPSDAVRLTGAFPPQAFYVPPLEVIRTEASRPEHGHFNLIHHDTGLKADCYVLGQDPLHRWALTRRTTHDVEGNAVRVAPLEYVIVRKLEWHRAGGGSRHLDDIRAMLRISGPELDRPALERWIMRLGLEREWQLAAR